MRNYKCLCLYIAYILLVIAWAEAVPGPQTSKPLVVFKDFEQDCNACIGLVTPILNEERQRRFMELQDKINALDADIESKRHQLTDHQVKLSVCQQTAKTKESLAQDEIQIKNNQTAKLAKLEKSLDAKNQDLKRVGTQLSALKKKVGTCEQAVANVEMQKAQLQDLHASCMNDTKVKDELLATDQALNKEESEQKDRRIVELQDQLAAKQQLIEQFNRTRMTDLEQIRNLSAQVNQSSSSCQGRSSDVHVIEVAHGTAAFPVFCDSRLAGPGWIVVLRRSNGSLSFDRTWKEYSQGFGNLRGEFFLGLEKLHLLTDSRPHELYIYLRDFSNQERYAKYDRFRISDAVNNYRLELLGKYSGTAGDSLTTQKSMPFSTPDRDNDEEHKNCAGQFHSGWWFHSCYLCNLHGLYFHSTADIYGINWLTWHKGTMQSVTMMIRPK